MFRRQIVLDRKKWKVRKYEARDITDLQVLHQVFLHEEYRVASEVHRKRVFQRYQEIIDSKKRPLIIDCGAHAGMATAYLAGTFPGATIIAVEPSESNLAQARKNCSHLDVEFVHAAVSASSGRGSLADPGSGTWGFRVNSDPSGDVRLVSIPELMRLREHCVPFIAKIDIEGFEVDLFSHNVDWIDEFVVLMVELHDWMLPGKATSGPFLRAISARDRDFLWLGENVFSIRNC